MNRFDLAFDGCTVGYEEIITTAEQCLPVIDKIIEARTLGYSTKFASINVPFDELLRTKVIKLVQEIHAYKPTMLIIVGIGGSNLGTKALSQALFGARGLRSPLELLYVDTVDPDIVAPIIQQAEKELMAGHCVILTLVTKSGTTTETMANAAIFIELLKKYDPDRYAQRIIVVTDEGTKLAHAARNEGWHILYIPDQVGGRYSVFSAVGLFPLALLGVDSASLHTHARHMVDVCTERNMHINLAARSAALLYILYRRGFVLHNFFVFSADLYDLGLWYRQLMAESLGREYTSSGEHVQIGITPLVSLGSSDLHSIVELHLGGPNITCTTFVNVTQSNFQALVPVSKPLEDLVENIQNRPLSTIMDAILDGTKYAYSVAERPFISVTLSDKSAGSIAQFMQWKMLEIIYLGYLLGIDPFVQPHVELYKKKTRDLLARY
jgi:glucose-6-phosphate isomerase